MVQLTREGWKVWLLDKKKDVINNSLGPTRRLVYSETSIPPSEEKKSGSAQSSDGQTIGPTKWSVERSVSNKKYSVEI